MISARNKRAFRRLALLRTALDKSATLRLIPAICAPVRFVRHDINSPELLFIDSHTGAIGLYGPYS